MINAQCSIFKAQGHSTKYFASVLFSLLLLSACSEQAEEAIDTTHKIDSALDILERAQRSVDSFARIEQPYFDSSMFTFEKYEGDTTNAYILKGDTSNPNIFLTPTGK